MTDLEVDRFGPWVVEISDADPPSPLFLPYLTREEAPLLSLKIPRKIETRSARPGMNLYDFLVSLYQRDLVILQRNDETVSEHAFQYRDIQYLSYGEDLLKGTVRLGLRDRIFDLPFNTVSSSLMQRMVALIREQYCSAPDRVPAMEGPAAPVEGLSFYFTGLLIKRDMVEPQYYLLASQANTLIASSELGGLGDLFFRVVGKTLLESLHFCDGRELKIVTRGQAYKYRWQAVYAKEYTYLPLENVRGSRWQSDDRHAAITQLTIETPSGPLLFLFSAGNPSIPTYASFLDNLSRPSSPEVGFAHPQLSHI